MHNLIEKYRFLLVFLILILFCLIKAIHAELGIFKPSGSIFVILIVSSIFIIGHLEKILARTLAFLITIILLFIFLESFFDNWIIQVLRLVFAIGFFSMMAFFCLYFAAEEKTINITTLFGLISAYLFIGLIFSWIYLLIAILIPNSFSGLAGTDEMHAMYFSFITLTTLGYGDITAIRPLAQTMTWFESVTGQIYLAVIIGQLVGRYATQPKNQKEDG